jgi:hypothetical protein
MVAPAREPHPEVLAHADFGRRSKRRAQPAVAELHRLPGRPHACRSLYLNASADRERRGSAIVLQRDIGLFDADQLAEELGQFAQRAAKTPAQRRNQRLRLFRRRLAIDKEHHMLVSFVAMTGVPGDTDRATTRDVDAIDRSFFYFPGENPGTLAFVGGAARPARADRIAVARLVKRALELVRRIAQLRLRHLTQYSTGVERLGVMGELPVQCGPTASVQPPAARMRHQ